MSPRAACRLETLGFERVYDYVAGKADWVARGLHLEGQKAGLARARDVVRDDAVTCRRDEAIGAVQGRVAASDYHFALVVSETGTVLGRLRKATLEGDPEVPAEELMEEGPSTVRPGAELADLARRLHERELSTVVVTTPEGRLLGVLRRSDAEARLA
jgi:CBS domain-containing protein